MGWERGYYYGVTKINGRVVRNHVGKGELGELAAQVDALKRAQRQAEVQERDAERKSRESIEGTVEQLCERCDLLVRVALQVAGYRQHKRGEWRKQRVLSTDEQ